MEHMEMRWLAEQGEDCFEGETEARWRIVTDEAVDPWVICDMEIALPDDPTGEVTAKLICDLHNQALALEGK